MYIRTKDGRIAEVKENMTIKRCSENVLRLVYKDNQSICVLNGNDDIVKQSENLEELCDLYIDEETQTIFHKHNGYVINWKTNMVYSLKALSESYHSVKGAIYTGKGLIYVAKMNENGELELI